MRIKPDGSAILKQGDTIQTPYQRLPKHIPLQRSKDHIKHYRVFFQTYSTVKHQYLQLLIDLSPAVRSVFDRDRRMR